MFEIKNLYVSVEGKNILKGIDLAVGPGEVHAIMGPNGSGKSTLAQTIVGHDNYKITDGDLVFDGTSIKDLQPDERALLGIFLAFQYPMEIPGVNNTYFLKAAVNAKRKREGKPEFDAFDFLKLVKEKMKILKMDERFLQRSVNEGFSGGEKKRNEILQMAMLEPKLAILDETDSGLDIDSLKIVADGVNSLRTSERSMIVVTHYQRLLDFIIPDFVHVLVDGKIIRSGGKDLAKMVEKEGYNWTKELSL